MNAAARVLRTELVWLADARHRAQRELINHPTASPWLVRAQIAQIDREMAEIDEALVVLGAPVFEDLGQADLFPTPTWRV